MSICIGFPAIPVKEKLKWEQIPMTKMSKKNKGMVFVATAFVLIFVMFGCIVFGVARRTANEMSASAVDNLTNSLDLLRDTMEALLERQAEFQKLLAEEIAVSDDGYQFISTYRSGSTIVKMSLVEAGETEGISDDGTRFETKNLDFSMGKTVDSLPISSTYINNMGEWAYTMACPVIADGVETASLYVEYTYESFDDVLPDSMYNGEAPLYVMDMGTERLVLRPRAIGERTSINIDLQDFYRANGILEDDVQSYVADSLKDGINVMFYHDILNKESLIYMWSVNDGFVYLIGYVPIKAIQKEGDTVSRNIYLVTAIMITAFLICCSVYFLHVRQQNRIRREQEEEKESYNKHLAEALQAAQIASNSKTTFLSNMSHDIRTPMNAVLGFTTLLLREADNPVKVREYAGKIECSGHHLLNLINEILDISKIESGKMALTINEFDLKELISSVEEIIRPQALAKRQEFNISFNGIRHERFLGDETRISQILLNLLSNSVKYTQEEGRISLNISEIAYHSNQYEHVRMEVKDNGMGMSQEYLEHIFDPFTREENSTTSKIQGTGLGMAITKNIVELMGGSISVESSEGAGSLFTVELELKITDKEAAPEKETKDNGCDSISGRHFLVAEDNEINSEILKELLELEGATCDMTENGCQVLEKYENEEEGKYDAILMDVQMPQMNGYDATRAIRALDKPEAAVIPIIAMTANAFAEDIKEAEDAGMNAHVSKPIDIAVLKKTIGGICRKQRIV
jgi:signal transduction histidine kinase/CheY-like chemotaxis protein